jgi:hypothetical protein
MGDMMDNETVIGRLGENAPEVFNRAFLEARND